MYIIPIKHEWKATWTEGEWTEHRITNLIPYHGHEITSKVHPLACGLGDLVHPQKGCYIGQEVLTRMRSRGKQGHRLVKRKNPVDKATTVGEEESLVLERIQ
jgi:folate-binding protein YgfZ